MLLDPWIPIVKEMVTGGVLNKSQLLCDFGIMKSTTLELSNNTSDLSNPHGSEFRNEVAEDSFPQDDNIEIDDIWEMINSKKEELNK